MPIAVFLATPRPKFGVVLVRAVRAPAPGIPGVSGCGFHLSGHRARYYAETKAYLQATWDDSRTVSLFRNISLDTLFDSA